MGGSNLAWIVSIALILIGLGAIFRGWQMHYRGRIDLISDWDSNPLPNPTSLTMPFFRVYAVAGATLCLLPIPLALGVPILIDCLLIAVVITWWFFAIDAIAARTRKQQGQTS